MGAPNPNEDLEVQLPLVSPKEHVSINSVGNGNASIHKESRFFYFFDLFLKREYLHTVQLGFLFATWYVFNILFNLYNKQVLKVFQYPVILTYYQFVLGSVFVVLMWSLQLYKKPNLSYDQLKSIFPLAVVHVLGNLFTNMSIGQVAVSFTHTVKALEPFFSVLLAYIFMGDTPTFSVIFSLFPIVIGVALASVTETSFNWTGFLSAMASNLMFQSRNVLSKKFMIKKDETLDNINLFSIVTLLSFLLLTPFVFFMENFTSIQNKYLNLNNAHFYFILEKATIAAICFHSYQQVSYIILQRVSVVTHSVGNCMKRVVVIISAVIFFKHPISLLNASGTAVALAGVFGYSQVKSRNK